MKSEIFLNVRPYQTRIALVKAGVLKNIAYHPTRNPSLVGSVYKGSVLRIDSVLNFAFIDIGHKKACFLYGKDLLEKSGNVSDVLKVKQDILIQIKADPVYNKGSRCTTEISLPGFYMVYVPMAEKKVVLSRQISDRKERNRLKQMFQSFDVEGTLIVRTLAEGKKEKELKQDLENLKNQWNEIDKNFKSLKGCGSLQSVEDKTSEHLKDFITEDVESIAIDDKDVYTQIKKDFESSPQLKKKIRHYNKKKSLFKNFDVESQIEKALKKKVNLTNGGSLIFEEMEAFTVIDVNTARYQGKKSLSEAILSVNLGAAQKIAEQIILRHLGGIIVVDFIDMKEEKDKKEVVDCLAESLKVDRLKSKVYPMADLGLVQITRKRKGLSLSQQLKESCAHCKGEGVYTKTSVAAGNLLYQLESHSPWFKIPLIKQTKKVKVLCSPTIKAWIEEKEQESLNFLRQKHLIEAFFVEDPDFARAEFKIIKT